MTDLVRSPHGTNGASSTVKLAICEDALSFRQLLAHYFAAKPGYQVRSVGDPTELVDLCQNWRPDLVLLDLYYAGDTAAARRGALDVRSVSPETKVVALTYSRAEGDVRNALTTNGDQAFDGYITKDADLDELDRAVQLALSGTQYVDPRVANVLLSGPPLSPSETAVLQALADGERLDDIAQMLPRSARTGRAVSSRSVRRLAESAREKFGARSTAEAIAEAQRRRLIH